MHTHQSVLDTPNKMVCYSLFYKCASLDGHSTLILVCYTHHIFYGVVSFLVQGVGPDVEVNDGSTCGDG